MHFRTIAANIPRLLPTADSTITATPADDVGLNFHHTIRHDKNVRIFFRIREVQ
ncbi:hypothetical protein ACFZAV_39840 [Streptomyces sp. NPDC008343]|uniref:hypothetical protein n=1 Tax=Streptomyces sp. NPDC008343 TaxID=3364828 RepID=UPI0036F0C3CE